MRDYGLIEDKNPGKNLAFELLFPWEKGIQEGAFDRLIESKAFLISGLP